MTLQDKSHNNNNNNNPRRAKQQLTDDEQSQLLPSKRGDYDEGVECSNGTDDGASFVGSVFNLSTTIIGAGIMALPAAMKVLGLVLGIAAIIFLALITETSLEILMRFSRVGKAGTYGEVMGCAFGKVGRLVLQISVLINNFGILVVYMIIIGNAYMHFSLVFCVPSSHLFGTVIEG